MLWRVRDRILNWRDRVLLMGIVNVTPDSFSDGGEYIDPQKAIDRAIVLVKQGADIIDFGGQSTRPDYEEVDAETEWNRLKPVLEGFILAMKENTDIAISVDTYFPEVAEKALSMGVHIINDVGGQFNFRMAKLVKETGCGYVIMYNGGGNAKDVKEFFFNALDECRKFRIDKEQICLDMGIGFGKSYYEDLDLLANVAEYKIPGYPLMLATSRKRVIGGASKQPNPSDRIYGNIAADTVAIFGGVNVIRMHDIENEKQGVLMATELKRYSINNVPGLRIWKGKE